MNSAKIPLRGKVAKVLNSRELVLNIGSAAGVKSGMAFDILDLKGENVRDPDTGEPLGSLNRPKVRVKVTEVREKMAVASTYRKKKVNEGGRGPSFGSLPLALMPERWVSRVETLRTTEQPWEDIDEDESYVKTGDPAVEVVEPEADSK